MTGCSQSFQDNYPMLYIFGKPRLRCISWLSLESSATRVALSIDENSKIFFSKNIIFRETVAYGTPCSQSFQDKWAMLYVFGKPRSWRISWWWLEVTPSQLAPSIGENVKNIFFNEKKSVMNKRKITVTYFAKKSKNKYIFRIYTIFLIYCTNKKWKTFMKKTTEKTWKMSKNYPKWPSNDL